MSEHNFSERPTNYVVCVFDDKQDAIYAKTALIEHGLENRQVELVYGEQAAADVDTSAKWFADTDEEMKKYERELRNGAILLSVPVASGESRGEIQAILQTHGGRQLTHFGEWVTEGMR